MCLGERAVDFQLSGPASLTGHRLAVRLLCSDVLEQAHLDLSHMPPPTFMVNQPAGNAVVEVLSDRKLFGFSRQMLSWDAYTYCKKHAFCSDSL